MKHCPEEDKVRFAIAQVFAACAERHQQGILGALVPHSFKPSPMICHWPELETEELCLFINQFRSYIINDDISLQGKSRLMILIYCHIMESEFPSTVIWNLLRIMNHEAPSWVFYSVNKDGKQFSCELPENRYSEIKKLAEKSGMEIGNVLDILWHNKLRNAFTHAQYIIHENGDLLGGKNISPITSNAIRRSDTSSVTGENPYFYSFSEINCLYETSLHFLQSFIQTYRFVIAPYKNGTSFNIPTCIIRWDSADCEWVTNKGILKQEGGHEE